MGNRDEGQFLKAEAEKHRLKSEELLARAKETLLSTTETTYEVKAEKHRLKSEELLLRAEKIKDLSPDEIISYVPEKEDPDERTLDYLNYAVDSMLKHSREQRKWGFVKDVKTIFRSLFD